MGLGPPRNTTPRPKARYKHRDGLVRLGGTPPPTGPPWEPSGSSGTQEVPYKPKNPGSNKSPMATHRASGHRKPPMILHSLRNLGLGAFVIVPSSNLQHSHGNPTSRSSHSRPQPSVGLNPPKRIQRPQLVVEHSKRDHSHSPGQTRTRTHRGDKDKVTKGAQPPTTSYNSNSRRCSNDPTGSPQTVAYQQMNSVPPPGALTSPIQSRCAPPVGMIFQDKAVSQNTRPGHRTSQRYGHELAPSTVVPQKLLRHRGNILPPNTEGETQVRSSNTTEDSERKSNGMNCNTPRRRR